MTIVEFIEARLAEDERIAQESDAGDGEWVYSEQWDRVSTSQEDLYTLYHAEHIARHDPARVLRQVAALRGVVDNLRTIPGLRAALEAEFGSEDTAEEIRAAGPDLRGIAAIWSDHPDFRPEWNTTP
ncbi:MULTISPECIES: DUF6221 family protein [Nocardia]|uniref:DUF6221 family protein n=1 Tax=Nocardia TaxID=1817 RepID=UPI0007A4AAE8|nr:MULTISPECIES: DUF6221 family protein [Nocardia]